jgi:Fic family protein
MKTLLTVVSAAAMLSSFAFGETAAVNQERVQVQNEVQNKFRTMSTDELLEKRGTMTTQQEREQLHNELMSRQKTMTKEQYEKFMKRPENRVPKMKNQGSGQGMMQGGGMGSGMGGGGMGGGGMGGR